MAYKVMRRALALSLSVVGLGGLLAAPTVVSLWRDRPVNDLLTVALQNEHTIYSDEFSERSFQRVRVGMTETQVRRLLGQPMDVTELSNGRIKRIIVYAGHPQTELYPDLAPSVAAETTAIIYSYSKAQDATADWHVRAITFTPDGSVRSISKKLHID